MPVGDIRHVKGWTMLRIAPKQTEHPTDSDRGDAGGDGLLVLALVASSWLIAIGALWAIWRLTQLSAS